VRAVARAVAEVSPSGGPLPEALLRVLGGDFSRAHVAPANEQQTKDNTMTHEQETGKLVEALGALATRWWHSGRALAAAVNRAARAQGDISSAVAMLMAAHERITCADTLREALHGTPDSGRGTQGEALEWDGEVHSDGSDDRDDRDGSDDKPTPFPVVAGAHAPNHTLRVNVIPVLVRLLEECLIGTASNLLVEVNSGGETLVLSPVSGRCMWRLSLMGDAPGDITQLALLHGADPSEQGEITIADGGALMAVDAPVIVAAMGKVAARKGGAK
jgi:hypothetical protein